MPLGQRSKIKFPNTNNLRKHQINFPSLDPRLGISSSILSSLAEQIDYYEPDALSCRIGYFMCNDSRLCIAQKLNCDSEANCFDGSDEWDCNDSAANLFWDSFYRKNIKAITDDIPWGTCRKNPPRIPLWCHLTNSIV